MGNRTSGFLPFTQITPPFSPQGRVIQRVCLTVLLYLELFWTAPLEGGAVQNNKPAVMGWWGGIWADISGQSPQEEIHSVVHMKSDTNCCITKKGALRERFKPSSADQSQHEVGVNVRLAVSKSYRNDRMHPTLIWRRKSVGGGGFRSNPTSNSDRVNWPLKPFLYSALACRGRHLSWRPASTATCNQQHKGERGR